ncbi:hypothetical protein [Wenxinia marina]|uniref:Oxidoreductase molybdopterin-binding domain-containing protein n=1 Tax=Wenxinia marina DSM 24838 TaxID=1123501 RepID=A0A0D0QA44_9RHOB|nr:hypothetical protein [Wenxinia marina]KIQ71329.1 hypothetical protein Wenmar_00098 [Wenxinia marina DSM 24838]GGL73944.1 hypothetical protein GCM10011392_30570 [Wenxinia marina]
MCSFRAAALIAAAVIFGAWPALAQEEGPFRRVDLPPIEHAEATLRVVAPDGTATVYTPEQLEEVGTWALTTATPWEDEVRFEGVLLADLLARHGLAGVGVEVIAENDYVTRIPPDPQVTGALLVATRADGHSIGRRERGPIYFVAPADRVGPDRPVQLNHLVWMAAEIRPGP